MADERDQAVMLPHTPLSASAEEEHSVSLSLSVVWLHFLCRSRPRDRVYICAGARILILDTGPGRGRVISITLISIETSALKPIMKSCLVQQHSRGLNFTSRFKAINAMNVMYPDSTFILD